MYDFQLSLLNWEYIKLFLFKNEIFQIWEIKLSENQNIEIKWITRENQNIEIKWVTFENHCTTVNSVI